MVQAPRAQAGPDSSPARVRICEESPPAFRRGCDVGFPDVAFIFNWAVRFQVLTGGAKGAPPPCGEIVQKVEGRKTISPLDAGIDAGHSIDEDIWETFRVVEGASVRCDMIQLVFYKQCRTSIELLLIASYDPALPTRLVQPLQPKGSLHGAEGKLLQPPPGFSPSVVRKLHVSVDHRDNSETCSWLTQLKCLGNSELNDWTLA